MSDETANAGNSEAAPTPALTLTPQPSPANGDGEVTGIQLAEWSVLYGTAHRQIRRWIERGKKCGEPCPLDDPGKMPAWIDKHLEKKRAALIEKVSAAAELARTARPFTPVSPIPSADPGPPATAAAPGPVVAPIDLATVGGFEGELYDFQLKACAAIQRQLHEAYGAGDDLRIGKLQSRLDKAGEQLRKYQVAAEQKAVRLGAYLPKAEAFNEIMQALHTLSLLREHRVSRVRAELADVPPALLARLAAVIDQVGLREEDVLRNLSALKSPADVSLALAA